MERYRQEDISGGYLTGNTIQLIRGGKDYFNLLISLIDKATINIHLQSYIFEDDETGIIVANALKAAAQRKVAVYLLADGYASQSLPHHFITGLKQAGVNFRFFEPFFKSSHYYFGRRMHHKIFISDARYCLVGGINIADRYNDMDGMPSWLDFALYAEGEIARQLCVLCWKTWNGFPLHMGLTSCEKQPLLYEVAGSGKDKIRMRRNDWVRGKNEISASYTDMLSRAQSDIIIMCSYFLPGKYMRNLLGNAAKRGVRIRVITAGTSDVPISKQAERWLYDWLLRNRIELFEYQLTVLHAKVAVCDRDWVTIGSYNLNNLSAYASIELNMEIRGSDFATTVEKTLENIIEKECTAITPQQYRRTKNVLTQFIHWCSYELLRLVFHILTFYYKQRA